MGRRTSIVLASVLKPVDDTRMFEKFGLSLSQTNKYDVNIIGFAAKNIKKVKQIRFYPIFNFKRLSIKRLLAPLRLLIFLFKVKPSIIIFNTPEILYVIILYKLMMKCKAIYDIQENYFRNILYNKNYNPLVRIFLSCLIHLKELCCIPFIDYAIFAEEGYKLEMPRWNKKAIIIKNTYLDNYELGSQDHFLKDFDLTDKNFRGLKNKAQDTDVNCTDNLHLEKDAKEKQHSYNFDNKCPRSKDLNIKKQRSNHFKDGEDQNNNRLPSSHFENNLFFKNPDHNKLFSKDKITIIYTGTIAENYGIFRAIDFIVRFHQNYPSVCLMIVGYCASQKVLNRVKLLIEGKDYIKLIGGDHLIPHKDIIQYIQKADFGLICYELNPSTKNCFPTKIYEYLGNRLPIIIQNYAPWSSFCMEYNAAVEVDFDQIDYKELYETLAKRIFYKNGVPSEIYWWNDEKKLLKLMDDIQQ